MRQRRAQLAGLAILGVVAILIVGTTLGSAEPEETTVAPSDETLMFEEMIRQDQRIMFDAIVSGDASKYPTIYYNDPAVNLHSDYEHVLSMHGDEARSMLATIDNGPIGAETGYLTARIASFIYGERNMAAWEQVLSTAKAEGRQPSIADLAEGVIPMERVTEDQWIEQDYHVFDIKLGGDHATANVAFGPPEAGGQILSYEFTRVDGRWYVSYMEASWSQGDPDYQGEGMP